MTRAGLRRALGLPALVVYGVGGMLGGGIYALVGEVAGRAGRASWVSFAVAMLVAAPTAICYAELVRRHPRSGGEAVWSRAAFGPDAARVVGWLVMLSGVVSMATLARAFGGYVRALAPGVPVTAGALALLAALTAVNLRGIRATSGANVACTAIEALGLLVVLGAGAAFLLRGGSAPAPAADATAPTAFGVLRGGALAFYAFIGFEDMVNVADEVRRPRRTLPVAILVALVLVGAGYVAVTAVATATVAPATLAVSPAPLTEVVARGAPRVPAGAFTVVALFAVANSALLNFVMASRLAYGMADEGLLPAAVGAVHPRFRTPHRAVLAVLAIAAGLAVFGRLDWLAGTTGALLLLVFATVDAALLVLRRREGPGRCPAFVPVLGILASLGQLAFAAPGAVGGAFAVAALGVAIAAARRARSGV